MNRIILVEEERIENSLFCLKERKANHILKILKSEIGDSLKFGLLNHSVGIGTIKNIDLGNRHVFISYEEEMNITSMPIPLLKNVKIFSSIQRPQTVKKMIQLSATCGVSELYFFPAEKSEYSYINSSIWSEQNILDEILLGLEQGTRIISPKIILLKNKYKIKEHLTESNHFILDFDGKSLHNPGIQINHSEPLQIVIGPESGLIEKDSDFFLSLGFVKISVSESILRSENALAFVLAQIELLKSCSTGK